MKEIHANTSYKIFKVTLAKGEKVPEHYASSDAFLILEKGKSKLQLSDRDEVLTAGATRYIPSGEVHSLQVQEDFSAYVVLAAEAEIPFTNL